MSDFVSSQCLNSCLEKLGHSGPFVPLVQFPFQPGVLQSTNDLSEGSMGTFSCGQLCLCVWTPFWPRDYVKNRAIDFQSSGSVVPVLASAVSRLLCLRGSSLSRNTCGLLETEVNISAGNQLRVPGWTPLWLLPGYDQVSSTIVPKEPGWRNEEK